jgi:hypothetical protein
LTVLVTAGAADGAWVTVRGHSGVTGRFRFRLPREKRVDYTYIGRAFSARPWPGHHRRGVAVYAKSTRCAGWVVPQHRCAEMGRYRIAHRYYPDTEPVPAYACSAHLGRLVARRADSFPVTVTDLLAEPDDSAEGR